MFNTIIAIIAAISLIYITASFDRKKSITTTDIIALIMSLLVFAIMCRSDLFFKDNCDHTAMYNAGYSDGYEQAIKDAILWDNNEYTYTISFDGELHEYANYYHED